MLELLSPAGGPESVTAAVQSGADAIYLGYGDYNARRNAKNFSQRELAAAVSYCHLRGVKVYLTLNTLLTDRELAGASEVAAQAVSTGVDAILAQDLGVVRMLHQTVPEVPVHGSTQLTIHSLDGVLRCAELGMSRVVLSRELDREAIAAICTRSPIEIEVFAHGALCMSYSGQCYFSAVIGGRSGNRGMCAQPCRLRYGWGKQADSALLSLKDLSLAGHLRDLDEMGVTCIKLEGRMKRPEYVAVVTGIYARAIREGRGPTAEEQTQLEAAFSRQGFTDGYYERKKGPEMFGVRGETAEPRELFARTRADYSGREHPRVPVLFSAVLHAGSPARVTAEDGSGRQAVAEGPLPEPARNRALTAGEVKKQLGKTGGTPYLCREVRVNLESGLALPLSALNALRRQALNGLSELRTAMSARVINPYRPGAPLKNRREIPALTVSLSEIKQLSDRLLDLSPALVYLPLGEAVAHPEAVRNILERKIQVGVTLPRICWDRERKELARDLESVRALGVRDALIGTLDLIAPAQRAGFTLRGDYGLGVYNSESLLAYQAMGFVSATASFELKLAQIRDLSKPMDVEFLAYGRLPLMITENCIIKNHTGSCRCQLENSLVDRLGEHFPVRKAPGCRNEILNAKTLFLADKQNGWQNTGLWAARLFFTTESAAACVQVMERYLGRGDYVPENYTRGLYYRGVE
ncbi:MAG: DUF3656 domain-containing protein [Intestinimonas sp.]|jgi:putative protease|nr:DUF3656 domain-containing protein [Intestinimonas sp.]